MHEVLDALSEGLERHVLVSLLELHLLDQILRLREDIIELQLEPSSAVVIGWLVAQQLA